MPGAMVLGRHFECETLDRLLDAVRAGASRVLVLRGEAGIGKTVLLEHVRTRASGCRVAYAAGVQSELELAYAGLHQLCAPMLDRLEHLPVPQRDALRTAFGLSAGPPPNRFLVGLAVLSLLSGVAEERPLVCLVDDAQWLDKASAQALAFAARRVAEDAVAVVFAARESACDQVLAGLPELVVSGLDEAAAQALLESAAAGPLDAAVRDRIVAETRGNPLALLELPREMTPDELAGGFALPDARALAGRIERAFRERWEALPQDARRLLLVAAAEPVGQSVLVWRAAARLGIPDDAAEPAAAASLLELGARARFRHPLVRSAVYRAAPEDERRRVHRALADVTDSEVDRDRRAWHRAAAAGGPDEDVAEELERCASRAQARGGLAAAAAFLQRAADLTPDRARRTRRVLAAARAKRQAGAFDAARRLLTIVDAEQLDALQRVQVDREYAQIAFASRQGPAAPRLLLDAAGRLEVLDLELARETYLEALSAALLAGSLNREANAVDVSKAVLAAPVACHRRRAPDLLLEAYAILITEGHAAATAMLKRAVRAFAGQDLTVDEGLRWLWLAAHAATLVWDDEAWHRLSTRQVLLARDAGALPLLPVVLSTHIILQMHAGDLAGSAALIDEREAISRAIGRRHAPYGALALAAWQGREEATVELIEATAEEVAARNEGVGLTIISWADAVLRNGLGQYREALEAVRNRDTLCDVMGPSSGVLVELVEAAVRCGTAETAEAALDRLSERTRASGTDWALGVEARSRALVSGGRVADGLYQEAIERLGRTRIRVHVARAHLIYGEWLRRERRHAEARAALRTGHSMLTSMGVAAFARFGRAHV